MNFAPGNQVISYKACDRLDLVRFKESLLQTRRPEDIFVDRRGEMVHLEAELVLELFAAKQQLAMISGSVGLMAPAE
jgi:hypothetical protein